MWEWLGSVVGYILGFASAVAAEPVRQWLLRPQLEMEFDPRFGAGSRFISLTPERVEIDGIQRRRQSMYVRMALRNKSTFLTARGCRAYLSRIDRREADGNFRTIHSDPLPVPWAWLTTDPIDIHPEMRFFFDVLAVNDEENLIVPQTRPKPLIWDTTLKNPASYRFTMVVSAENGKPKQLTLGVEWNGRFELLQEDCFSIVE